MKRSHDSSSEDDDLDSEEGNTSSSRLKPTSSILHPNVIVHIDIDCFYATVEMILSPTLRGKPIGIQQKRLVVTTNYEARSLGVEKMATVEDAKRICPELVLINGEDLSKYREMSEAIYSTLQSFTIKLEKLGLDENFVDITDLVNKIEYEIEFCGHVINLFSNDNCSCGCRRRLIIGSHIAQQIRAKLFSELGVTSSAGIAHNKLLAKLVGSTHKPNQQTSILPSSASDFMRSLDSPRSIPGIGSALCRSLDALGIVRIEQLQLRSYEELKKALGCKMATRLQQLSFGIDDSTVAVCDRPKSIGVEDGFRPVNSLVGIREKMAALLHRLWALVHKDGRTPGSLKLTVRQYFRNSEPHSRRFSRQMTFDSQFLRLRPSGKEIDRHGVNISPPSSFSSTSSSISTSASTSLSPSQRDRLLEIAMDLFVRISVEMEESLEAALLPFAGAATGDEGGLSGGSAVSRGIQWLTDDSIRDFSGEPTAFKSGEAAGDAEVKMHSRRCAGDGDGDGDGESDSLFVGEIDHGFAVPTSWNGVGMLGVHGLQGSALSKMNDGIPNDIIQPAQWEVTQLGMSFSSFVENASSRRPCTPHTFSQVQEPRKVIPGLMSSFLFPLPASSHLPSSSSSSSPAQSFVTTSSTANDSRTAAAATAAVAATTAATAADPTNPYASAPPPAAYPAAPITAGSIAATSARATVSVASSAHAHAHAHALVNPQASSLATIQCPIGIDVCVFRELPREIQQELAAAHAHSNSGSISICSVEGSGSRGGSGGRRQEFLLSQRVLAVTVKQPPQKQRRGKVTLHNYFK